jgi:RHS repeat-associated protein
MPVERKHTQHIEYLPYGETFFERRDYWNTLYKFNAKELDAETGLYYYGARYYTPEVSVWLSVDPLADKYPSMSPFMYCAGNPMRYIDPDGRVIVDPKSNRKVAIVNGEWRTIKRYDRNGNAVYGNVSKKFVKSSQPILDLLISTKTGMTIYNSFQEVPTEIVFDIHDSYNLKLLNKMKSNSIFTHAGGIFEVQNGFYKGPLVITPDLDRIRANAIRDGIDFMEKFLQTMEVEKTHTTVPYQIGVEKSYGFDLDQSKESKEDCYSLPLNNAVKIGKQYRDEMLKTIDGTSNLPIINFNKNNKTNVPLL